MQSTIKSEEVVAFSQSFVTNIIYNINLDLAYSVNAFEADKALVVIKIRLETFLEEIEKADARQELNYPLDEGWYEKSRPTKHRPYKLPEAELGSIQHLILTVLIAADRLMVRYFETENELKKLDTVINEGAEDDPHFEYYSEFINREKLRWRERIRTVMNKVKKASRPLRFSKEVDKDEPLDWWHTEM